MNIRKNQNGFAVLGIFLLSTIFIILLLVYFQQKSGTFSDTELTHINKDTRYETDRTKANFEEKLIYAENGFSFFYPGTLELFRATSDGVLWRSQSTPDTYNNLALILRRSKSKLPNLNKDGYMNVYDWEYPHESLSLKIVDIETETVRIGTTETIMYSVSCGNDCYYHILRFESGNTFYELIADGAGGGLITRYKNILQTLDFYDPQGTWRTYTSTEGNYTFQYPNSSTFMEKVSTSTDGVRNYAKNVVTVLPERFEILFERTAMSLAEYLNKHSCETIYIRESITVDGEPAEYQSTACGIEGASEVYVKHDGILYVLKNTSPDDPILETFTFNN